MKKLILLLSLALFTYLEGIGQNLELTPFTGYTFDHSFPLSGGRAKLGGGQTFGGMLGFRLRDNLEIETIYSYQSGTSTARSPAIKQEIRTDTQVHYMLLGANWLYPTSPQLTLFSGLKAGAGILSFPNSEFIDRTKFTVGINGGMKYFLTDNVGLRLQANLMVPISNVGANLWWSPGAGTSVGLSGWSSIIQFGLTGGIAFRL
jgi:opacity protein-like surface antigen